MAHNHCQEQSFECTHIKWTCASAHTHSHTCNIKWTLHLYLWEVFAYFTTVMFESDLLCKFMRWRFLQNQKYGGSYSYCGSCLKSKLLIFSTGTHKMEGIRHSNWNSSVVLWWSSGTTFLINLNVCCYFFPIQVELLLLFFILNCIWIVLINYSDGDEYKEASLACAAILLPWVLCSLHYFVLWLGKTSEVWM